METRIATIDDADDLFVLNGLFDNNTTIDLIKKSLMENDREIACIAFADGIPVGYCCGLIVKPMCYDKCRVDIEALFVREEYRRQGAGMSLIKCIVKRCCIRRIVV